MIEYALPEKQTASLTLPAYREIPDAIRVVDCGCFANDGRQPSPTMTFPAFLKRVVNNRKLSKEDWGILM